jgi:hypothetical protein
LKIKIQKLYAWSIVLEPMLFFVVTTQNMTGVGGNVSRMLQVVVLLFLIRLVIIGKISFRISNFIKSKYSLFVLYFCMALISGSIGLLMGGYSLDAVIGSPGSSLLSGIIRSSYFRPCFEYVILAYYIGYFAVLPSIIFKKEEDVKYFFKVFFLIFNISLIVGLFFLALYSVFGVNILAVHFYEWYGFKPRGVGRRFHGLFGEPRDAFVVLGLGAAFYYLRSIAYNKPHYKLYYALIVICMVSTQSASGAAGVGIFVILYMIIVSLDLNLKGFIKASISVSALCVVFYFGVITSARLGVYMDTLSPEVLKGMYYKDKIPGILTAQMSDIYPIFWIVKNLSEFNLIPLLLGGGVGSLTAVNSSYGIEDVVVNPHANITRVLAETGIIGCFIYISAFFIPVKRLTMQLPNSIRKNIIFCLILVLSLTLGQRSAANFIFLGVLFAVFNTCINRNESKEM